MSKKYAYMAAGALLALSLTGCPAVTNALKNGATGATNTGANGSGGTTVTTAVQTAISNVLADFGDAADLSGDTSGAASFLSSAQDDGSGSGVSVQSLRSVEDVSGNLSAGFSFPTMQSSADLTPASPSVTDKPTWLFDIFNSVTGLAQTTNLSRNKRWLTTTTYYVASGSVTFKPPFGEERTVVDTTDNNKVHEDEITSPEATASSLATAGAPAIFVNDASPSLEPASELVRDATISFPVYGYTDGDLNTAVGSRWGVYNTATAPATGSYYPMSSWMRAVQINRQDASGSVTVDHYDIATDYTSETIVLPNGTNKTIKAPYEYITDDYNAAKKTEWHNDRTYTPNNTTWTGNGYFVTASGATHSVSTTWNAGATSGADVWTRTATWTNSAGQKITYVLDYNFDESGTGSISVNGTQFATLAWGTDFKGTATLSSGTTFKYRVPRP